MAQEDNEVMSGKYMVTTATADLTTGAVSISKSQLEVPDINEEDSFLEHTGTRFGETT